MPEPLLRPPSPPRGLLTIFLDWKHRLNETDAGTGVKISRQHPVGHSVQRQTDCCECDHRLHVAMGDFPGPTQSGIRSRDRLDRAHEYLEHFNRCADHNAVLAGDMNWDEDLDGPFPIEGRTGWVDAWCELRGSHGAGGWTTYDSVANPMLRSFKPGRTRPDRFLCKLRDFDLDSIEMIGTEAIPSVTYYDDKGVELPVLPSHRFGLLLTLLPKHE